MAKIIGNQAAVQASDFSQPQEPVIQGFFEKFYEGYPKPHSPKNDINQLQVKQFVDGLSRRDMRWYDDTREQVLARTPSLLHDMPYRTTHGNIAFRQTCLYECQCCHEFIPYGAVDIGHIMPWKDYLKLVGAANTEEALIAYNELENLRVECSTCNRSHDYEKANYDPDNDFLA